MNKELKRSVTIAGHNTSLSLEPEFWEALRQAARREGKAIATLIAEIDGRRGGRNLSSAIRVWLLQNSAQPAAGSASRLAGSSSTPGAKGSAK